MKNTKIVIIGAGSAIFGPNTIATILQSEILRGSELALVDLSDEALRPVARVAERLNEEWNAGMTITATTDRSESLDNANFVIVSIEVQPREILWRLDWEISQRHGLRQPYGENGGPGGMMHTFRQLPPLLAIARDMEQQCPDALLINFSNPLPRLSRALTKYSDIRVVGKCHQIKVGYALAAVLLREKYGFEVPDSVALHSDVSNVGIVTQLAQAGRERFQIRAAGLNHFTWILDIRDRQSGEDLYTELRNARDSAPPSLEPLSIDLFQALNYCPVPGDTHLAEYLPWTHDPLSQPWEHYNLRLYDWDANEMFREFSQHRMMQMASGDTAVSGMRDAHSEGAVEVIEAVVANLNRYEDAVNIPNEGAIPNLPSEAIVEVPGIIGGDGVHGLSLNPLPGAIAELLRREAALVEVVVDAGVHGDRDLALQALLLDPMVGDIRRARMLLADYLEAFADYLPQFC